MSGGIPLSFVLNSFTNHPTTTNETIQKINPGNVSAALLPLAKIDLLKAGGNSKPNYFKP